MHDEYFAQQELEGRRIVKVVEALEKLPLSAWKENQDHSFSATVAGRTVVLLHDSVQVGQWCPACLFHWKPDGAVSVGDRPLWEERTMLHRVLSLKERVRRGLYEARRAAEDQEVNDFIAQL